MAAAENVFEGLGALPSAPPGFNFGGVDHFRESKTKCDFGAIAGMGWSGGPPQGVVGIGPTAETWPRQGDAEVGAVGTAIPSELYVRISEQVKHLLLHAKRDSEAKVKSELRFINETMRELDAGLDSILGQLIELENAPQKESVEQHTVEKALNSVEQAWAKELRRLKQELHQMIFAHNHNADLMKQQKEAIGRLQGDVEQQIPSSTGRRRAQLAKIEVLMKWQRRLQKLDPFFERIEAVEERLATARRRPVEPPRGNGPPGVPRAAGVGGCNAKITAIAAAASGTVTATTTTADALALDVDTVGVPFSPPHSMGGSAAPGVGLGNGGGGSAVAAIWGGRVRDGKDGDGDRTTVGLDGVHAVLASETSPPALGAATEFSSLNASEALAQAVAAALAQASSAASAR